MAVISLQDAFGADANAIQFNLFSAVGCAVIPNIVNPAVGWYRIADIDKTGLTYANAAPYSHVFIMTGGYYANGIPSSYAIVASLAGHDQSARARITQLDGQGGDIGNYPKIRFSLDGTVNHIEVYQTYAANSNRGKQVYWIGALGGKLKTYSPTAPIATEPAGIMAAYTVGATAGNGVPSIERSFPVGAGTAGTYIVFARFPLGNSSARAHASLMVNGGGGYSSASLGTFVLDCTGRGSAFCRQKTLIPAGVGTGMEFGVYAQDGYVYVGMKRPAYSSDFTVQILNQASNVTAKKTPVELDTFYDDTTMPTGWTAATIS